MMLNKVTDVSMGELGEIMTADGTKKMCKVMEIDGDVAVVQLFGSAAGINPAESTVKFLGHGTELAVSEDMLGRVFDGLGRPVDGGPELLAEERLDVNGLPMNPAAREYLPVTD